MDLTGATPLEIKSLRGLFTLSGSKRKVPDDFSPDTRNTSFKPGRVFTRPGISSLQTGETQILSIKEYVLQDSSTRRILMAAMASGGPLKLRKDNGSYVFSDIATDLVEASVGTGCRMKSTTLFGKEYIALAKNGQLAASLPLQYDDTNLDPYAPPGPAGAPTAADSATAGSVVAGVHKFRVFFKTRTGYWTAPGPSVSLTAAGSKSVDIASVPVGPSYVVGRVIAATPYCSDDYYFIEGSAMVINDNSTTSVTIDFSDTALIAGTIVSSSVDPTEDMLGLVCIPEQSWSVSYKNRLFWGGGRKSYELNGDIGPLNMRFCGGFNSNLPLGWTEKVAGESKTTATGGYGDVLKITGTGIANQKGCLENNSQVNQWIPTGVGLSVRVRAKKSTGAVGHLYVYTQPTTGTATTFSADVLDVNIATDLSDSEWRIVSGSICLAANNQFGSTRRIRISVGGKVANDGLANNDYVLIDWIEVFPTGKDYALSDVWASKVDDPESIDGLTGHLGISREDGQGVRSAFVLRNNLYFVKDNSVHVTTDTGDEPANWPVESVSSKVGSPSVRGVGTGDEWAVIAGRAGCYLFNGATFKCISTEIQKTWNTLDWSVGHTVVVSVNAENNRILVAVPLNGYSLAGTTSCKAVLSYDYIDDPFAGGEWSVWFTMTGTDPATALVAVQDMILHQESDGSQSHLVAIPTEVGKVADGVYKDWATLSPILSWYVTRALRVDPRRNLLKAVTGYVEGSGTLAVTGLGPDFSTSTNLGAGSWTLASNPNTEHEKLAEVHGETVAIKVAVSTAGDYYSLERLVAWIQARPGAPLRGDAA